MPAGNNVVDLAAARWAKKHASNLELARLGAIMHGAPGDPDRAMRRWVEHNEAWRSWMSGGRVGPEPLLTPEAPYPYGI